MADTVPAREAYDSLAVGDVLRVPAYEGALRVNYVSPADGAGLVGVEFVDEAKERASKSFVQNVNSGRVYLMAGSTDKGEVTTFEFLTRAE